MRFLSILSTIFFISHLSTAGAEPRSKTIDLHKRTALTVYIPPDLGTRFTFPFILDEQDSFVPFTLNGTNKLFLSKREPGRNYFVITNEVGSPIGMLGNIFLSVAGFEISIELRVTNDLSKHYSDIVFNLTDDDREDLIQKGIAQRTKMLEDEYKKKISEVDNETDQKVVARIGRLALSSPSRTGIKEEATLKLPNGDKIILFVDQFVKLDSYSIIVFDIIADSGSRGVNILDVKLLATNTKTKQTRSILIGKDIPGMVQADKKVQGAITVLDGSLIPKELLKLQVLTDKGIVEVEW
jgi:hypothetical protein